MHRHELPVQIVAPNRLAGRIRFTNPGFCLVGAGSGVTLFDRLSVRATGIGITTRKFEVRIRPSP
jgi:hypothetical protein